MASRRRCLQAITLVGAWAACSALAVFGRRSDSEPDLLARMEREKDPIRHAKLEVRLARVKLLQAMAAMDKGDAEGSQKLLAAYLERVKSAWATLRSSGHLAAKKPAGFKELEIELREDARYLVDLKHRYTYTDRAPVEKIAQEVDQIRAEVLQSQFPTAPPGKR